jgi:hypothetical protein
MSIVGRKAKAGVSYGTFGCTAYHSRGAAICANGLSVSEKKASQTLVNALKEKLDRPELIERFIAKFEQRTVALRKEASTPKDDDIEPRVRACERRLANLTESLAKVGWSDALAAKLREEEAQSGR